MKAYIATKFENTEAFHQLSVMLKRNGHTITHNWTAESTERAEPGKMDEYLADCAHSDLVGVEEADVLIFIPVQQAMAGAWVEFGIALELGRPIIVIDNGLKNCIFYHSDVVIKVKDFYGVITELARLSGNNG